MKTSMWRTWLATVALALAADGAQASVVVSNGVTGAVSVIDFSLTPPYDVQSEVPDFEAITDQWTAPAGVTFSGDLATDTNTGDTQFFYLPQWQPLGPWAVASNFSGGSDYLGPSFTAAFASPVWSVGFLEALNPGDQVSVSLFDRSAPVGSVTLPGVPDLVDDGAQFVAFKSSSPFDEAVFTVGGTGNGFFAMDDFTTGVPEPRAWALMLVGVGFCGSARRRSRAARGARVLGGRGPRRAQRQPDHALERPGVVRF